MYKALYRKYRPEVFSDVVGQEHITTTLTHQVENGSFSHAYLFTGSRGTGKTTCAKILSRAVNCLNPDGGNPCGECANCRAILSESTPDVIELDAASNRRIDDIRDLRDRVAFAPQQTKYKVYIIDEVHMLTNDASNALLKTLEEPPSHVIFILATTEVHEILPTILSRCQRYDFKRIEPESIAKRLSYVAKEENLTLTDDAAMLIADIADGGMRDALSVLDVCSGADSTVDEALVNRVCGRASLEYIMKLGDAVKTLNTAAALEYIAKLHADSVDIARLTSEMCVFWRNITLIKSGIDPNFAVRSTADTANKYLEFSEDVSIERALYALKTLNTALSNMNSGNKRDILEMAIIKLCNPQFDKSEDALLARIADLERKIASGAVFTATTAETKTTPDTPKTTETPKRSETVPVTVANGNQSGEKINNWHDIIAEVEKSAPLIAAFLSGSTAEIRGTELIVNTEHAQLIRMLSKPDDLNYIALKDTASSMLGRPLRPKAHSNSAKTNASDPLAGFKKRLDNLEGE